MATEVVVEAHESVTYDGTNSAELLTAIARDVVEFQPWSIQSETGGVLTFVADIGDGPYTLSLAEGDRLVQSYEGWSPQVWEPDAFASRFRPLPDAVPPVAALSLGTATTPSIGANAQATVSVPLSPAQPSATYLAASALSGSAQLLGSLSIVSTTIVDADTVHVVVRNGGLLALAGATVIVSAVS